MTGLPRTGGALCRQGRRTYHSAPVRIERTSWEQLGRDLRQRDWWSDITRHEGIDILPGPAGEVPYLLTFDWVAGQVAGAARDGVATGNLLTDGKLRARVEFAQDAHARVRFHDGRLLVFDRAGRLVDIDCASGLAHGLCLS